ncbi:MAG: putative nucleotidyltransferase substrate binding domain-containing protein [Pseudohaliea sp.]
MTPLSPPVELASVGEFLAQSLPFDLLEPAELDRAVSALLVSYHPHGDRFDAASEPAGLRIVRSGAVDLRDSSNKLLDRLGEGENFHIGNLNAGDDTVIATVIEDSLLYLLPDEAYRELRAGNRAFDRYFSRQRSRRLRRAARYMPEANPLLSPLRESMSTDLLCMPPDAPVQAVAAAMAERRVSSAFISEGDQLLGIVTDRDLRTRCLAAGLPASTAVRGIMTPDPEGIGPEDTIFNATLLMTQRGFHHLPVLDAGRLVGVITTSDLILARRNDPVYLVQHLSRQDSVEGMVELLSALSDQLQQWVSAGMRAEQVSRLLTAISDAVTVRLIQLAERAHGPAPGPWAWLGFGSQARGEQLLGADQDNGIVIDDRVPAAERGWYAAVARSVCDGLAACGYKYCPGGIMATTDEWRQPLATWQDTVAGWTRTPTPAAVMRVSIFFDLRTVYGEESLCARLQQVMLERASSNTIFLAALAANALANAPPLGIFRRFVVDRDGEHRDSLDLKKRGVLPITEIVRLHALAHKLTAVNTNERLEALAAQRHLTIGDSRNLADALHCIQQQRIRHQCQEMAAGEPVDNFLNPRKLPRLAREQLRDAFTIIDEAQGAVRQTYRAGMG